MPEEDIVVDGATGQEVRVTHSADSEIYKARRRALIDARLAELDKVTGPRWAEVLHKGENDPFILEKIAEKEALRAERRQIDE